MLLRPLHGSPLLVFSLLRPLVLLTLVARSFCTAPAFLFVNSWVELEGRFLMAEFSRRGSFFRISSVYAPNRTPSATNSLPHVWTLLIHLFPRYYEVTSMLFLTEPRIVGALILLSSSVRALSHWGYFSGCCVFWMFGAISIPIFTRTPG